ncbi:MAG TPA: XdhC family protein [Jatrophihabitans sp.]|nr:XdhC family protein [Jatrophihabitans sp.]
MYDIVEAVTRWRAEDRPVTIARLVDAQGIGSREPAAAVAHSPGQPLAGRLFSGAADTQLPELLAGAAGLVELRVTEPAAAAAGLACGGTARLLAQPAGSIPAAAWRQLREQRPVCLVTDLDTLITEAYLPADLPRPAPEDLAEIARVFRAGASKTAVRGDLVVSAFWPTPRLFVVGDGQVADALAAGAALLGWDCTAGTALPDGLTAADNVVVLSHDLDVSGRALTAALDSSAGYVGALGSRHTQAARAGWLREHGVPDGRITTIHGPAGLDIGSRTPAEIALSILAEIVSVRR